MSISRRSHPQKGTVPHDEHGGLRAVPQVSKERFVGSTLSYQFASGKMEFTGSNSSDFSSDALGMDRVLWDMVGLSSFTSYYSIDYPHRLFALATESFTVNIGESVSDGNPRSM